MYVDLVVSVEVAVEVCCYFTVFFVKQRLKCNTSKGYNCLIQLLLTVVHEKRIQHFLQAHSDIRNALYFSMCCILKEIKKEFLSCFV
jgi:hypothetical protein